jgi:quercetin dioxygenase-like cupin family protein
MTPLEFHRVSIASDLINQTHALKEELIMNIKKITEAYSRGVVDALPKEEVKYGVPFKMSEGWIGTLITETPDKVNGFDIVKKEGKEGYSLPLHYHNRCEKSVVIVSGLVRIETESVVTHLYPMQAFHIKNSIAHTITAVTDCVVLSIFKPPLVS